MKIPKDKWIHGSIEITCEKGKAKKVADILEKKFGREKLTDLVDYDYGDIVSFDLWSHYKNIDDYSEECYEIWMKIKNYATRMLCPTMIEVDSLNFNK